MLYTYVLTHHHEGQNLYFFQTDVEIKKVTLALKEKLISVFDIKYKAVKEERLELTEIIDFPLIKF